jgi:hypothetical protein
MTTARNLAILLCVQLAFALISWWPQDHSAGREKALLDIPADSITSVAIARAPAAGGDPAWLELERGGDGWVLASEQDYPAEQTAVDQLLERLVGVRVREPIATRRATHNALKVGDDEYGRRVRVATADGEYELVVGAALSRSVNIRLADSDDVYVASGFSEWSLQETPASYWNADYVRVAPAAISAIHVRNAAGEFDAVRDESGWTIAGLEESQVTNTEALDEWLRKVVTLRLLRPVSASPSAGLPGDESARISWTIQAENESVGGGYALYRGDEDRLLAKSDSDPFVVEVSQSSADPLLEITRTDLVGDRAAPDEIEGS